MHSPELKCSVMQYVSIRPQQLIDFRDISRYFVSYLHLDLTINKNIIVIEAFLALNHQKRVMIWLSAQKRIRIKVLNKCTNQTDLSLAQEQNTLPRQIYN